MTTREYAKPDDPTRPTIVARPETAEEAPRDMVPDRSASEFTPVLARMPNLEASETQTSHRSQSRRRRGEGRLLSAPMAVPLLLGAGVVLVLLAVVPLLIGGKGNSPSTADNDSNSWHPGVPAPEAPTAAKWDNPNAAQGNTLQALSDAPHQLNWNSPAEGSNWDLKSPPSVWDNHSASTTPDSQLIASSVGKQEVPSWQTAPPISAGSESQPAITAWNDPGTWPYASESENQADTLPSPTDIYGPISPGPAFSHNYQQPQTGLYQSQPIAEASTPAGGHMSGVDTQYARQFDPETGRQIDYQAGSQTAYQSTYPPAAQPIATNPAGTYQPERSYPADTYQADRSGTGNYPVGDYPAAAYRTPEPPTESYSTPPSYRAGTDTQQAGPGVARFQGRIEKPAVRTSYDRDRSGVY